MLLGDRLTRVYQAAAGTGRLRLFIVFGSFVSAIDTPNDVDVFLEMEDDFDTSLVSGDAAIVFDHPTAQIALGASIFWMRRAVVEALGESDAIEHWQVKRDGTRRGIVEVVSDDSE